MFNFSHAEKPVEVIIDCHVLSFGDINEVEMVSKDHLSHTLLRVYFDVPNSVFSIQKSFCFYLKNVLLIYE